MLSHHSCPPGNDSSKHRAPTALTLPPGPGWPLKLKSYDSEALGSPVAAVLPTGPVVWYFNLDGKEMVLTFFLFWLTVLEVALHDG